MVVHLAIALRAHHQPVPWLHPDPPVLSMRNYPDQKAAQREAELTAKIRRKHAQHQPPDTITRMLEKMRNNDPRTNEEPAKLPADKEKQELEKLERKQRQFWNFIISGLDVNLNSFYSLFQKMWWHKAGYKFRCKECLQDLSL